MKHRKRLTALAVLASLVGAIVAGGTSQAGPRGRFGYRPAPGRPHLSGVADVRLLTGSGGVTNPKALDRSSLQVASDDVQVSGDNKANPSSQFGSGEGFPANETAVAVNPTDPDNVIAAANDYEAAVDSVQGIYASFDGGHTWPYSRHNRQVITPDRQMYGSGDPVVAFDREGVAYASMIAFGRANCDSYIAVQRSLDKGVTWTAPVDGESEGSGLTVGDGIAAHNGGPDDCQIFHDKEWMTTGKRPPGTPLVEGTDPNFVSPDRLYVTWTRFDFDTDGLGFVESPIYIAYSDDQGRNWSEPQEISGSAPFCNFQFGDPDGACDEDQFSVPVVDPRNGHIHVAFQNFNTSSTVRSRYAVVTSTNGGQTWSDPVRVTDVFDGIDKYPICEGSQTLDFMCARTNAAGNIDIDPNNGDLYIAFADNRNGTATDTNTDVFVVRSTDGGDSWSPPRRVKRSIDDQWFPWLSVAPNGTVAVSYFDRSYGGPKLIDTTLSQSTNGGLLWSSKRVSEVSWNPDLAFRLGTFIGDYNGLDTTAHSAIPVWTDARFAEPNFEGNNPSRQQSDVMTDVEPLRP